MAAPGLTVSAATTRPIQYLDRWTQVGFILVIPPLLVWGAVSVFMLVWACGIPWWAAWIPALSTTGVTITSSRLAMRRGIDQHIRRLAGYLTGVAVLVEMVVAGLQHALPETLNPPGWLLFFIGCLPTAMGVATYKVWGLASAAQDAANAAAETAVLNAADRAETARIETAALAERLAVQAAVDTQRRTAELAHQEQLTALATQAAEAEVRRSRATQTVANAVNKPQRPTLVPDPPVGPVDALGRPAKPSPKRDAALRWLLDQLRDGRDLDTVTPAEVDRAVAANGYARRNNNLITWIADVREYVAKGAA